MEHMNANKTWFEPEVIVLLRSKPEEAVLEGCKLELGGGPELSFGGCTMSFGGCAECYPMLLS